MRREEYEDHGVIFDYVVSQSVLKDKLGITESRMIRDIDVSAGTVAIDLGIYSNTRIKYHLSAEEFKGKLGIEDWAGILYIRASVWDRLVQVRLAGTHPQESRRIR